MESEVTAAPRAKKRRSEAPDGQQSEQIGSISPPLAQPVETNMPDDPKPFGSGGHRSRSQDPRVGGEGGGGGRGGARRGRKEKRADRISALPDDVLRNIISFLPTKDAGRTPTLAKKWKHLWSSAPLNLDCLELPGFPEDDDALATVVSKILSNHQGPGRSLSISTRLLLHYHPGTVDAWLQSPALDNLEELFISAYLMDGPEILPQPTLPAPIFRFALTLSVATLTDCTLPDTTVETLHFPMLKKLALEHVSISEGSLHYLIARCPILEYLLLVHSYGFHRLCINSASLIGIGVCHQQGYALTTLEEIIVQDAPCLERFLYLEIDMVLRVSVIAAPKLAILGCLNDFNADSRFMFGSTVIQRAHVIDPISTMSSVKMLAIHISLSLDTVINLMRCFPSLETLYIQAIRSVDNNFWRRKHRNFIRTHDIRLKTIVLQNYHGRMSEVNFATFFILNAKMLEMMRFEVGPEDINEHFIARQNRLLQLEKRAAKDVEFHSTVNNCDFYLAHIKHVHDLSVTNPFECTC